MRSSKVIDVSDEWLKTKAQKLAIDLLRKNVLEIDTLSLSEKNKVILNELTIYWLAEALSDFKLMERVNKIKEFVNGTNDDH